MKIITQPTIQTKFENYPTEIKEKLTFLRQLILKTAKEIPAIEELEETLKWGEPSFLVKKGSTIRIDWKAKKPNQYAIYFKCTSKLVSTFKEVYPTEFKYENTRAILFNLEEDIQEDRLKKCIAAALQYHDVKQLPQLGMMDE